jgi:predicted permease
MNRRWMSGHVKSPWRRLFHREQVEKELDEEIRSHLELLTQQKIREGLAPEEAVRSARNDLGGIEQVKEQVRAVRFGTWFEALLQDGRFGLRMLCKKPGFSVVAILTLALGIGASTAIFTLLSAILYRELPVAHAEQLVQLQVLFHNGRPAPFALPMFQELQRDQQVFTGMLAWSGGGPQNVEVDGNLRRDNVLYTSGEFYSLLEERPLLGRLIEPADANPSGPISRVAVISYGFWKSRFGGDPRVPGRQILIENQPFTIIGVTRRGFVGLDRGTPVDITIPITALGAVSRVPLPITSGHYLWLNIIGRLKPHVSIAEAHGQLSGVWPAILADVVPPDEKGDQRQQYLSMGLLLNSAARGPNWNDRARYWRPLYYLMGMVGLILLAVCVNLASLMVARGASRMHETSVRLALGATRWRIAAQTVVEGLLLSSAGALLGLVLGFWGAGWIFAVVTRMAVAPVVLDLRPDFQVLAFTAGVAILTGLLFGLVPSVHATTVDPGALLRSDSRLFAGRSGRVGQALVVAQVSLSLMLVLASVLFTHSFWNLRSATSGFDRASVLNLWLLERPGSPKDFDAATYYRVLTDRLNSLPGVRAAGLADFVPGGGQTPSIDHVAPINAASISNGPVCNISWSLPGFFQAIGMRVLGGRDFEWGDGPHQSRVAIVSSSLAERLFPRGNAIGSHVNIGTFPDHQNLEIVGIANDARLYDPRDAHPLNIFIDPLQYGPNGPAMMLFVRTVRNPLSLAAGVRQVVDSFGHQFVTRSATLEEVQEHTLIEERLAAMISTFFGVFALLLACIGLYGLIAQTVERRTREIGIRMAIGAQPRNIMRLVLGQALVLSLAGIALGVAFSFGASRLIAAMLYGVSPHGVPAILGASLVLLLIGLLAGYVPARRAMHVDAMEALRYE